MYAQIFSNKFENLCLWVGEMPEGKVLDVDATDAALESLGDVEEFSAGDIDESLVWIDSPYGVVRDKNGTVVTLCQAPYYVGAGTDRHGRFVDSHYAARGIGANGWNYLIQLDLVNAFGEDQGGGRTVDPARDSYRVTPL